MAASSDPVQIAACFNAMQAAKFTLFENFSFSVAKHEKIWYNKI